MHQVPARQPAILPLSPRVIRTGDVATRLPVPLSSLIGREHDLASIHALLSAPGVRLVSLIGPPGIGKSRLALAIAQEWERSTEDDVYLVSLAAVSDPAYVLSALARALEVRTSRGVPLGARVTAMLQARPALLVLDNFERVVAAAPLISDLLASCPRLKVLITSRVVLRIRGEHEWPVPPLAVPPPAAPTSLASLATSPSVALLLERARAARAELALTPANASTIAAICVRLEGIPLAIELAAPWLKLFSPAMLLERLEQRLTLLRGGAQDLPAWQQTLEDAIAWSDDLLQPSERWLFQCLSTFVDGWTLEAAQSVCAVDEGDAAEQEVVEGLSSLINMSLVQRESGADGAPRFRMLDMIREYARAQLATHGAPGPLQERHASYYLRLAESAASHLYRADQAIWMERLEHELGNLRAALRWLIDQGDKERALRLGTDLENFWLVHDHLRMGQSWLIEIIGMPGEAHPQTLARARQALATLMQRQGDYAHARSLYEVNLAFARESGDEALCANTLLDLGSLDFISGDLVQGTAHVEQAAALGRTVGDWRTVARALNQLGEVARYTGDEAAAVVHYEASLRIWRELADHERIAMVLHNLAPVVARQGDRRRAGALFAESLSISWGLRNIHGAAICLFGIAGATARGWSQAVQAARLLGAADALRASIGVRWQPVDRAEYDRSVAVVRAQLDDASFAAAWEQGQLLTLADAVVLARELLSSVLDPPAGGRRSARDAHPGGLTRRENEVAQQVALGKTNREIADALFIAEKTVEMHISRALSQLGFRSRAQLAAWVVANSPAAVGPVTSRSLGSLPHTIAQPDVRDILPALHPE